MAHLRIVGWDKFQHYKDRDPPWVKLYRDLLTSECWVLGTDTSRLVQVASVLLAARYNNEIPLKWALLRRVASLDCSEIEFNGAITHLRSHEFVEVVENQSSPDVSKRVGQDASEMLASCATTPSALYSEAEQSRGEQSRKDNGAASNLLAPEEREPDLHASLPLDAWQEWLKHRKRKRWPCDATTLTKQLNVLKAHSEAEQRAMIDASINAGWQGIFEPKGTQHRRPVSSVSSVRSADEIEADERARGIQ